MRYETLLFTRNQREDFTAFVRPGLLTNKDVSTIGGIFNYVSDISRVTADFPSLYFFPLSEYVLLLRHYDSGRKHAGRAIGTIEGIAVKRADSSELARALPHFVEQQALWLDVTGTVEDIETQAAGVSAERTWSGQSLDREQVAFVGEFLARRDSDRLFVPFTAEGREMLITALADARFDAPPFFAFGTNSDVLAQLERQAPVDIVSFFKTESASFRNRKTNRVSQQIGVSDDNEATHPSMALRPAASRDEMQIRPQPVYERDDEEDEETLVGSDAISLRTIRRDPPPASSVEDAEEAEEDDAEPTVLTIRQLRDRIRERELAQETKPEAQKYPHDPIHWLLKLVASIISPNKPK